MECLSFAEERFPDAIGALSAQAMALAAMGRFDEMEGVLERAAALEAEQEANDLGGVLRTAGSEAMAHGHEAEGRRLLDRAVRWYEEENTRTGVGTAFWYGYALYHAGRHAEARDAFQEAADADPDEPDYRTWVAICEAPTGEPADAGKDWTDSTPESWAPTPRTARCGRPSSTPPWETPSGRGPTFGITGSTRPSSTGIRCSGTPWVAPRRSGA